MRQILTVGMDCGRKEILDGGRRQGIINDSCLLTCENGDVIKRVKADRGKRRKLKFQIYKFMYRM